MATKAREVLKRAQAHKGHDENDSNPRREDGLFWWVDFHRPGHGPVVIVRERTRKAANAVADQVQAALGAERWE